MKNLFLFLGILLLALPLAGRDLSSGESLVGDYLEARTAEVFVGHCLANSEVSLAGQEAVLALRVREGGWNDVPLAGLSVVTVVQGDETLGDLEADPVSARGVLIVDSNASPEQHEALVELARSMVGTILEEVVAVESASIEVELDPEIGLRRVRAGELAALEVRERHHHDGLCGNEGVYYPPLVDLANARPTYTLTHEYSGKGLTGTWKSPEKSSSWVGTFIR